MRMFLLIAMLLLMSLPAAAVAADRLGVFVGVNYMVFGGHMNEYNVAASGAVGGLLIPVHVSRAPLFVKIKAVYHRADYVSGTGAVYDEYMHASNSFLVGAKTWRGRKCVAQLLLGPGIQNESAYAKWGAGVASAEIFVDVSLRLTRNFRSSALGAIASFEHGFTSDYERLASNQRVFLAALALF